MTPCIIAVVHPSFNFDVTLAKEVYVMTVRKVNWGTRANPLKSAKYFDKVTYLHLPSQTA